MLNVFLAQHTSCVRSAVVCYFLFASTIAFTIYCYGGVIPNRWSLSLFALGMLSLAYGACSIGSEAPPRLGDGFRWPILLLPLYTVFQMVPLPFEILKIVSPFRAHSLSALSAVRPGIAGGPLSILPSGTFSHLLRICAYTLTFLLIREFAYRFRRTPWWIALPVVAIGAIEGLLGLFQHASGAEVRGTYANRNHYACLLELALPFATLYLVSLVARSGLRNRSGPGLILNFGAGTIMFLWILFGEFFSLSRMGLVASLCSLVAMATLAINVWAAPFWKRALALGLLTSALVLGFVFLSPSQTFQRFATFWAGGEGTGGRAQLWRETLPLIAAYPVFGCGLGGYESAFLRFKVSDPMYTDDYAHNDYLQILAEAGVIGFLIGAVLIGSGLVCAVRRSLHQDTGNGRWLGIACTGSFIAILIHSTADFNLYIPANALIFAWILGISASLNFYSHVGTKVSRSPVPGVVN